MTTDVRKRTRTLCVLLFLTCLCCLPYLTKDLLPIEHDTFFHLSRIEQLSKSIAEGNFLPAIYPYENMNFGYASPLFYSDVLFLPSALLHLMGLPLSICYKGFIFVATLGSAATMYHFAKTIEDNAWFGYLSATAYVFANYHITDIYVRGAVGEVLAFVFLPLVLEGMYRILWKDETNTWILSIGLIGLVLSHNLTFMMGVLLCIILFFVRINQITKEKMITLTKSIGFAFLATLFFTIPMIEQLKSQPLMLQYGTDLSSGSMNLWQYFINETIFGYSGNTLPLEQTMTVNIGWFLTFAPILYLVFDQKKKEHPFVMVLCVVGYIALILPSSFIPWNALTVLRTLQFPWRINTIALVCLCIPATYGIYAITQKRMVLLIVSLLLCCEGIYHVIPVYNRTFGISSSQTWSDVLAGNLCDPCYSATYVRVEIAGADYLPITSPDFRTYSKDVLDEYGNPIQASLIKHGTSLTFTVDETTSSSFSLPLTYYKGYQVTKVDDSTMVNTFETSNGMVGCDNLGSGTYICTYQNTILRTICMNISLVAICVVLARLIYKRKQLS